MEALRFDDKMIMVQLVADRAEKDDCRAHTSVVWHGKGDIQAYPERLWHKLAPHPDVWRIVDEGQSIPSAADRAVADARRIKADAERAAGTNTDVVVTLGGPQQLTAEQLETMPDEDIRAEAVKREYALHPRLNSLNLRIRFLEAQELDALGSADGTP